MRDIYGVTNGVKDTTALVEGTTDANGAYSLTVEDYTGPLVIEITAGTDSVMVCEVFTGCNGVAFGQDLELTSDFSLKAVVSDVQESEVVTTNITGKLTELEVVNLTNPDDVNAAGGEVSEAAILNAALLAAALGDAADGTSLDNALATVIADFAANDGQMMNNESTDGATVSLAKIFAEALAIIKNPSFAGVNLGTLESINSASTGDTYSIYMTIPDTLTGSVALDVETTIAIEISEDPTTTGTGTALIGYEEFAGVGS
jgi:hypothetical protein